MNPEQLRGKLKKMGERRGQIDNCQRLIGRTRRPPVLEPGVSFMDEGLYYSLEGSYSDLVSVSKINREFMQPRLKEILERHSTKKQQS